MPENIELLEKMGRYIIIFVGFLSGTLSLIAYLGVPIWAFLVIAVTTSLGITLAFTLAMIRDLKKLIRPEEETRISYKVGNLTKRYGIITAGEDWHTMAFGPHFLDFPCFKIISKDDLGIIDKKTIDVLIVPYQSVSYFPPDKKKEIGDKLRQFLHQDGFLVSFEWYMTEVLGELKVEPGSKPGIVLIQKNHKIFTQPQSFNPNIYDHHHGVFSGVPAEQILATDYDGNPLIIIRNNIIATTIDVDYHYPKDSNLKKANEAGKLLTNIISWVDQR